MQKDLNYRIPKFNADVSLGSKGKEMARVLNDKMLAHVTDKLKYCTRVDARFAVSKCFKLSMGNLSSTGHGELSDYLKWLNKYFNLSYSMEEVVASNMFEPEFSINKIEKIKGQAFPLFKNGKLIE